VTEAELLVALLMAVGLVGVVLPALPGLALIWGATLGWALLAVDGIARWFVLAVVTALFAVGTLAKYLLPGRALSTRQVPARTLVVGAVGAIVGFFVVPIIGAVLFGVLGVLLAELARLGSFGAAWRSTRSALVAVGIGMLVELAAAIAMIVTWVAGALLT
jgi:uncharacterized protein